MKFKRRRRRKWKARNIKSMKSRRRKRQRHEKENDTMIAQYNMPSVSRTNETLFIRNYFMIVSFIIITISLGIISIISISLL